MSFFKRIRKEVKVAVILIAAVTGISLVQKRQSDTICTRVHVNIINPDGSNFVTENEISKLVSGDQSVPLTGNPYRRILLKEVENRVETNGYIEEAEAYKDHRGDIYLDAYIACPLARILRPGRPDQYITEKGNLIETSPRYTARVLVIGGDYVNHFTVNVKKDTLTRPLFDFLTFINHDEFWKAQIVQISINKDGEMILYPQVTRQYIQFGTIDGWEKKMAKLKIFYDRILPFKGWNSYTRVNLKYENQIICE